MYISICILNMISLNVWDDEYNPSIIKILNTVFIPDITNIINSYYILTRKWQYKKTVESDNFIIANDEIVYISRENTVLCENVVMEAIFLDMDQNVNIEKMFYDDMCVYILYRNIVDKDTGITILNLMRKDIGELRIWNGEYNITTEFASKLKFVKNKTFYTSELEYKTIYAQWQATEMYYLLININIYYDTVSKKLFANIPSGIIPFIKCRAGVYSIIYIHDMFVNDNEIIVITNKFVEGTPKIKLDDHIEILCLQESHSSQILYCDDSAIMYAHIYGATRHNRVKHHTLFRRFDASCASVGTLSGMYMKVKYDRTSGRKYKTNTQCDFNITMSEKIVVLRSHDKMHIHERIFP